MLPKNPGKAIKILAIITFFAITIVGIIVGWVLSEDGGDDSLVLIPISPIVGFVSSILLYGFGELIERVKNIDEKIAFNQPYNSMPYQANFGAKQNPINAAPHIPHCPPSNDGSSAADELKKYTELKHQGALTEEEFQAKKEQLLKLM